MKEAFEKIKERLEEAKKSDVCEGMNCCDCDGRYGYKSCDTKQQYLMADKCMDIVSEVEAEYEDDVCEWHKCRNGNAYQCDTHAEIHDSRVLDWYVCPYCEKKIKVVE